MLIIRQKSALQEILIETFQTPQAIQNLQEQNDVQNDKLYNASLQNVGESKIN